MTLATMTFHPGAGEQTIHLAHLDSGVYPYPANAPQIRQWVALPDGKIRGSAHHQSAGTARSLARDRLTNPH